MIRLGLISAILCFGCPLLAQDSPFSSENYFEVPASQEASLNTLEIPVDIEEFSTAPLKQDIEVIQVQNYEVPEVQIPMDATPISSEVIDSSNDPKIATASVSTYRPSSDNPYSNWYVRAGLGISAYPIAFNVNSNLGFQGFIGKDLNQRFFGEGGLALSRYSVEEPMANQTHLPERSLNQYNLLGAFGMNLITGRFEPFVKAGLSYTYRSSDYTTPGGVKRTSSAADALLGAGLSVRLSDNFDLVGDFNYMLPMVNNVESGTIPSYVTSIEDENYYILNFSLKYNF